MSKLLISLLALEIGVSLSHVLIFTWKSNCLGKKEAIVFSKWIVTGHTSLFLYFIK